MEASLLPVISLPNGVQVVDSRLIAEGLGITHKSFMETIRTYQSVIEKDFGQLPFETAVVNGNNGGGNPTKYALLNEQQATFLGSLSRNTPEVVSFKVLLIRSYFEARQKLIEARDLLQKPLTSAEALLASVQRLVDIEREQAITSKRLDKLEAEINNVSEEHYSLEGYYGLRKWKWNMTLPEAQEKGRKLKALSGVMNLPVNKCYSVQYGEKNAYHKTVLDKYFNDIVGKS
jgi:phage regulator Rha-like protein